MSKKKQQQKLFDPTSICIISILLTMHQTRDICGSCIVTGSCNKNKICDRSSWRHRESWSKWRHIEHQHAVTTVVCAPLIKIIWVVIPIKIRKQQNVIHEAMHVLSFERFSQGWLGSFHTKVKPSIDEATHLLLFKVIFNNHYFYTIYLQVCLKFES